MDTVSSDKLIWLRSKLTSESIEEEDPDVVVVDQVSSESKKVDDELSNAAYVAPELSLVSCRPSDVSN